jgi:hypothetical protein
MVQAFLKKVRSGLSQPPAFMAGSGVLFVLCVLSRYGVLLSEKPLAHVAKAVRPITIEGATVYGRKIRRRL